MATTQHAPSVNATGAWLAETPVPGLLASPSTPLPFAPGEHVRSFLLERDAGNGNVLIYGADLGGVEESLDPLGGVSRHYLGHWHEAGLTQGRTGAPLLVHTADRPETEARLAVRASFTRRHMLDDDLEVIPIPGHTPGSTAYLWDSGRERVLFTADTLYVSRGEWVAAVLDSSDRDSYLESLELLRGLDFDVLAPWVAGAGEQPLVLTGHKDAQRRIGDVIRRLEGGRRR